MQEKFSTKFAGQFTDFSSEGLIPPKTDKKYDETIRYAIVAAKKAMRQAGIEKVCVCVGLACGFWRAC